MNSTSHISASRSGSHGTRFIASCCLLGLLAACLAAPVPARAAEAGAKPLRIVTSFYPIYLATLNVAGGVPGVEVVNLTQPMTGCLHDYQLTPADMVTLTHTDLFVVNGGGMEAFLARALRQNPRLKIINASEGIALLPGTGGEPNPHIWVAISGHRQQVSNIAAGLAQADPARGAAYAANAKAYMARLATLDEAMHAALKDVKTRDIVTFHEAFPYFAREFGLRVAAVIEREPGAEPSARELAATIETVRKTGVKALFTEPQYPAKAADVIARETGARLYILDPIVTGPPTADAYLVIMEKNLKVLQAALQ